MDEWKSRALESYVKSRIGDREGTVLAQGYARTNRALPWWERQLQANGMAHITLSVDPVGRGAEYVTRQDLFDLAGQPGALSDDDRLLTLLWHVVWWGSGSKHSRVAGKIRSFADLADRARRIGLLRVAAESAKAGDLEAAYRQLQPGARAAIPELGPSYFTKFLYFATGGGPALIMDARATASLRALECPWSPGRGPWSASQYATYCAGLDEWAREVSATGLECQADEIEFALFQGQ